MHANFAEMLESENVGSPSEEQLLRGGKKPNNFTNNFSNGRSGSAMEKYSQTQQDCQFLQLECARLRKYLYGLTAVVVAGVLILVITISVLFGKLSHDLVNHSHQPKVGEQISKILETEELCIPCDSVRLGPSVEEDKMLDTFIRRQTEQSGEECCVEKPKQLLALLELVSLAKIFFYYLYHFISSWLSVTLTLLSRFQLTSLEVMQNCLKEVFPHKR